MANTFSHKVPFAVAPPMPQSKYWTESASISLSVPCLAIWSTYSPKTHIVVSAFACICYILSNCYCICGAQCCRYFADVDAHFLTNPKKDLWILMLRGIWTNAMVVCPNRILSPNWTDTHSLASITSTWPTLVIDFFFWRRRRRRRIQFYFLNLLAHFYHR